MTESGPDSRFSFDNRFWWTGTQWVSAISEDQQWRFDGTHWVPNRSSPPPANFVGARDDWMRAEQVAKQARKQEELVARADRERVERAAKQAQKELEQARYAERRRIDQAAKATAATKREEQRSVERETIRRQADAKEAATLKANEDRSAGIEAQVVAALAGEPPPPIVRFISDDQRFRWNGTKWRPLYLPKGFGISAPAGAFAGGSRSFIARPDEAKRHLIYKWPDKNIRKWSQVTVEPDELAVFFRDGIANLVLPPGRWTLDSSEIPILGTLLDSLTGGSYLLSELYFVTIRECPNLPFSGSIDNVIDPASRIAVSLRTEGSFALKVIDPRTLIARLSGTGAADSMDAVVEWACGILLKIMRTEVVEDILASGWPMLGIVQHSDEIEVKIIERVKPHLKSYGLSIVTFGDFLLELQPQDADTLKAFSRDVQYSKLAGGYGQYSVGKAMQGVGEGSALGGGASNPALVGIGLGLGGLALNTPAQSTSAPAQIVHIRCQTCGQLMDESAAYCSKCGEQLGAHAYVSPLPWTCESCQRENDTASAFCSRCGAKAPSSELP